MLRLVSEFRLFYKNPVMCGEIFEFGDDDDVPTFENVVYQILPQTLTLFVVDCGGNGGDGSGAMINQAGSSFPVMGNETMYQQFPTTYGGSGGNPYFSEINQVVSFHLLSIFWLSNHVSTFSY